MRKSEAWSLQGNIGGRVIMNTMRLLERENILAKKLISQCGELIQNTEELILILEDAVEITSDEGAAFYYFNKQTQNALFQCLLSILRKHEVQARLILRHSLETAILASYSLHVTTMNNYIINDEIGAKPINQVKTKAYKWVEKQYPDQSLLLQRAKKQINEYYAHGNMFNSLRTLSGEGRNRDIHYFDREDLLLEKTSIWEIGFLACIAFDLIYQSSKTSNVVKVNPESFEQFKTLVAKSQTFRVEFMQEKRFARWHKSGNKII